jgi:dTDP-4-amino-4,6-dideoxygalactose transaminase
LKIPLARPWFDEADEQSVLEALRTGWVGQGPKVAEFERRFAGYVRTPHATTVSSCSAALHLAALAAGFGPGDEVLVPAFTWISTANAVELTAARPVFCDIDPITFNIDVADAARRVTERTRGIIPVHLFGLAADLDGIAALARKHRLFVIEDAACALGCYHDDRHVGTVGDVGCFSFHPRKSITTGEGGMLTTGSESLNGTFRSLRDIGSDRAHLTPEQAARQLLPDYPALGFNYRLTDLQAALGLSQLSKFDAILEQRLECARRYSQLIDGSALNGVLRPPQLPRQREHAYQAYVCRLTPPSEDEATLAEWHARRNDLMRRLFEAGIATRPGTHAPHMLGYYRNKYGLRPADCPQSWRADWLTLALPLYAGLTAAQQEWICARIAELWPQTERASGS